MMSDTQSRFLRTLRLFDRIGFEPVSFVAIAEPASRLRGAQVHYYIQRMFRYEKDGVCSVVDIAGPARSAWRRDTARGLQRAGYELRFSSPGEATYRRWVR